MAKDYAADFTEVEQEIRRLQNSPHVHLAHRAQNVLRDMRSLMYDLREQEKLGRVLEKAGITNEYLDKLTDGNDGDVDWMEQYG